MLEIDVEIEVDTRYARLDAGARTSAYPWRVARTRVTRRAAITGCLLLGGLPGAAADNRAAHRVAVDLAVVGLAAGGERDVGTIELAVGERPQCRAVPLKFWNF